MALSWKFEAIGTHWAIDVYETLDSVEENRILKLVRERIELFDITYSRFKKDSWLSSFKEKAGMFDLPPDALPMISLYNDLYQKTSGLMTPLMGQVLSDAGYDATYSLKPSQTIASPADFNQVVNYDMHTITTTEPVAFDFGALGKGYLVDIVAMLLEQEGLTHYCVDAGGDMKHRNTGTTLRVGLENPENAEQVIGVIKLGDKSIAGSSGNRRRWAGLNHIINPKTLLSPSDILAIWVVADTTIVADAMTTALYFATADELGKDYVFDYLILKSDHSVEGTLIGNTDLELY